MKWMKVFVISLVLLLFSIVAFAQQTWNPPNPKPDQLIYVFVDSIGSSLILVDVYDTNGNGKENLRMVYLFKPSVDIMGGNTKLIQYGIDKNGDGKYSESEIFTDPVFSNWLYSLGNKAPVF